MKLVYDRSVSAGNPRNSEGSFIRLADGGILFAFSRYRGDSWRDHAGCDIAGIRSYDEGETWSEPEILVSAAVFGVENVMSVSAVHQKDGAIGLYFLIKENGGNTTIGRARSLDGNSFLPERCRMLSPLSYYVISNDRFERLRDGTLAVPAAMHAYYGYGKCDSFSVAVCLVSEDDGKSFSVTPCRLTVSAANRSGRGLQEPGLFEHEDGVIRLWARTTAGFQYEAFTRDRFQTFTLPQASVFSSPASPMEWKKHEGVIYSVYNPTPSYNSHFRTTANANRTPLVLQKSTDDGRTWSEVFVIESDPERGYCYPALFFTRDKALLCAYCRGGLPEEEFCLQRLGMMKIPLSKIP